MKQKREGKRVEMESLVHLTPASRHSLRPAALNLGETKEKNSYFLNSLNFYYLESTKSEVIYLSYRVIVKVRNEVCTHMVGNQEIMMIILFLHSKDE